MHIYRTGPFARRSPDFCGGATFLTFHPSMNKASWHCTHSFLNRSVVARTHRPMLQCLYILASLPQRRRAGLCAFIQPDAGHLLCARPIHTDTHARMLLCRRKQSIFFAAENWPCQSTCTESEMFSIWVDYRRLTPMRLSMYAMHQNFRIFSQIILLITKDC